MVVRYCPLMSVDDLLVCSVCHGALGLTGEETAQPECRQCGRTYKRRGEVFDMTPLPVPDADVAECWPLWEELQRNGSIAYEADPETNLSYGRRWDAEYFAEFSDLEGLTLDVGCGPQAVPSYGLDFDGHLIGIDPLVGVEPREFDFIQGIGEYLPFADETFDRVLFATSLDHMLVPTRTLAEARRVVRRDGLVSIWFSEHHHGTEGGSNWSRRTKAATALLRAREFRTLLRGAKSALKLGGLAETPSYMSLVTVPTGAKDHFHAFHLDAELVQKWTSEAGLATVTSRLDHAAGCFLTARPAG